MRRLVAACLLLVVVTCALSIVACAKGEFVGSSLSTTYHDPDCVWAQSIDKERRVWFKTASEAEAAGYSPCSVCLGGEAPTTSGE